MKKKLIVGTVFTGVAGCGAHYIVSHRSLLPDTCVHLGENLNESYYYARPLPVKGVERRLQMESIKNIQRALKVEPTGFFGPRLDLAVRAEQERQNMKVDGKVDQEMVMRLGLCPADGLWRRRKTS